MKYKQNLINEIYFLVYSSQIKWEPIRNQASVHKGADVGPVHGDILISKMRPGHELDLQLVAVKGIGKDHAKFSPVGEYKFKRTNSDRTKSANAETAVII